MKKTSIRRFLNLVTMFEDYVTTGFSSVAAGSSECNDSSAETDASAYSGEPIEEKTQISGAERMKVLQEKITGCKCCHLHYSRTHAVPGDGVLEPEVFIVSGKPDEEEDRAGALFPGTTGEYLDKWLSAIQIRIKEHCFIGSVVRCRPPENREPRMEESNICFPYLEEQITILKPRAILCLGRTAGQLLAGKLSTSLSGLRDQPFSYRGIPLVVTYHPEAVLVDQDLRKPVWEDLKRLKKILDRKNM